MAAELLVHFTSVIAKKMLGGRWSMAPTLDRAEIVRYPVTRVCDAVLAYWEQFGVASDIIQLPA